MTYEKVRAHYEAKGIRRLASLVYFDADTGCSCAIGALFEHPETLIDGKYIAAIGKCRKISVLMKQDEAVSRHLATFGLDERAATKLQSIADTFFVSRTEDVEKSQEACFRHVMEWMIMQDAEGSP